MFKFNFNNGQKWLDNKLPYFINFIYYNILKIEKKKFCNKQLIYLVLKMMHK